MATTASNGSTPAPPGLASRSTCHARVGCCGPRSPPARRARPGARRQGALRDDPLPQRAAAGAARGRILAALAELPPGLELREGRLSIELRPTGAGDKGSALRQVVERYRLRGAVVVGDDVTDLDMFRAAAELRAEGRLAAAIVAVGGGGEVPAAVADAADLLVASPAELVALLAAL